MKNTKIYSNKIFMIKLINSTLLVFIQLNKFFLSFSTKKYDKKEYIDGNS